MKPYCNTKYILHLCILRVIVVGPFAIARSISETIFNVLDKVTEVISDFLPVPYTLEMVEFDQLPKHKQKEIIKSRKIAKEQIMHQTVNHD